MVRGQKGRVVSTWRSNMLSTNLADGTELQQEATAIPLNLGIASKMNNYVLTWQLMKKLTDTTLKSIKKRVTERMKGIAGRCITQWLNNLQVSIRTVGLGLGLGLGPHSHSKS